MFAKNCLRPQSATLMFRSYHNHYGKGVRNYSCLRFLHAVRYSAINTACSPLSSFIKTKGFDMRFQ